jgi:hypothetical protein
MTWTPQITAAAPTDGLFATVAVPSFLMVATDTGDGHMEVRPSLTDKEHLPDLGSDLSSRPAAHAAK